MMFGTLQVGNDTLHFWMIAAGVGIGLLAMMGLVVFLRLKSFKSRQVEK